jgi:hypothetical protein
MSYNIDTCKIKKLKNLVIPMQSFYTSERTDWHPDRAKILNTETMECEIECGCEQSIKGILKNDHLHVSELNITGEGSGSFKYYVLDHALKSSKGVLEASLIWEGGDSVTSLSLIDGVLVEKDIEL